MGRESADNRIKNRHFVKDKDRKAVLFFTMIKGVSKQIIEIAQTENPFFERAVFFVRREYIGGDEKKLTGEAWRLLSSAKRPPNAQFKNRKRVLFLRGMVALSYPVLAAVVYLLARG